MAAAEWDVRTICPHAAYPHPCGCGWQMAEPVALVWGLFSEPPCRDSRLGEGLFWGRTSAALSCNVPHLLPANTKPVFLPMWLRSVDAEGEEQGCGQTAGAQPRAAAGLMHRVWGCVGPRSRFCGVSHTSPPWAWVSCPVQGGCVKCFGMKSRMPGLETVVLQVCAGPLMGEAFVAGASFIFLSSQGAAQPRAAANTAGPGAHVVPIPEQAP